jgi:tRNA(Ile2) C34 agmatinyltransferase TiaS
VAKIPPCPRCGTNRHANARADGDYYCSNCRGLYDNDPNEGGTHSDFNPAVRLELEERAAAARAENRAQRLAYQGRR